MGPSRRWLPLHAGTADEVGYRPRAKLVVPLIPRAELDAAPPSVDRIAQEIDAGTPPSLAVHPKLSRREWEPLEDYRRPCETSLFRDCDGIVLSEALYIVFRSTWEIDDDDPYRRQLLFEHVQG